MDLNISYDQTISVGNQVTEKGAEFQQLLNNINTVNNNLQSYWQGSDASKYSTAVATQAQNMQQLVNTINEIGQFLVQVGNAYKEVAEQNAGAING